jgi:hypothetical protein
MSVWRMLTLLSSVGSLCRWIAGPANAPTSSRSTSFAMEVDLHTRLVILVAPQRCVEATAFPTGCTVGLFLPSMTVIWVVWWAGGCWSCGGVAGLDPLTGLHGRGVLCKEGGGYPPPRALHGLVWAVRDPPPDPPLPYTDYIRSFARQRGTPPLGDPLTSSSPQRKL